MSSILAFYIDRVNFYVALFLLVDLAYTVLTHCTIHHIIVSQRPRFMCNIVVFIYVYYQDCFMNIEKSCLLS